MEALEAFVTSWCLERERFGARVFQTILKGPDGFLGSFQQIFGYTPIYVNLLHISLDIFLPNMQSVVEQFSFAFDAAN